MEWREMFAKIAIDAAKNCIHVFEEVYPGDDRPRKALEAAETCLKDPSWENKRLAYDAENRVWHSRDWERGRAHSAAHACGYAARAARKPSDSVLGAIDAERFANDLPRYEYSRIWLWRVLKEWHKRECELKLDKPG